MAVSIKVSTRYGTHLPCLIKAMEKSTGDVLELGLGVFSTPYLHYQCILSKRRLVSYENFESWKKFFSERYGYLDKYHDIHFVKKYADAKIDRPWDVVLIDQTPDASREETIRRVANKAKFIIIHDSAPRFERQYGYDKIYSLFKHKAVWTRDTNQAAVLSNFVNLDNFWR